MGAPGAWGAPGRSSYWVWNMKGQRRWIKAHSTQNPSIAWTRECDRFCLCTVRMMTMKLTLLFSVSVRPLKTWSSFLTLVRDTCGSDTGSTAIRSDARVSHQAELLAVLTADQDHGRINERALVQKTRLVFMNLHQFSVNTNSRSPGVGPGQTLVVHVVAVTVVVSVWTHSWFLLFTQFFVLSQLLF